VGKRRAGRVTRASRGFQLRRGNGVRIRWRLLAHSGRCRPLAAQPAAAGGRALSVNAMGANALPVAIPLWRLIYVRTYVDQQSDPPVRGAWPVVYGNFRIPETDKWNLH